MHSSMNFAIFIHPYTENLNQNIKHNHHHPQKVRSALFQSITTMTTTTSEVSTFWCLLPQNTFAWSQISYKWKHTARILLCLASLVQHNVFEIHACCWLSAVCFFLLTTSVLLYDYFTVSLTFLFLRWTCCFQFLRML